MKHQNKNIYIVSKDKPTILVTNDDGIHAKGIKSLVEAIKDYGNIIVISAHQSFSAMSHAITVKDPLYLRSSGKVDDIQYYETNGTPADCVKLALHFLLETKPDFILSGINHGTNSSTSVHYSGTLGAAREGCINGVPSIGFSLLSHDADADFTQSKEIVKYVVKETINNNIIPEGTYLNVNIPNSSNLKGIKFCRQAKGKWVEEFLERTDPRGNKYFWLTGHFQNNEPDATDTDEYYLEKGYVSIVPCKTDLTDFKLLNEKPYAYDL